MIFPITLILKDLQSRFGKNILAIYGIGSYFDETLPIDWEKNDVDIIVVLESLNNIPKKDWTTVRFERKVYDKIELWIGFNTLNGLLYKNLFQKQSFANYEWSLLDLKYPRNSLFLYGTDIRNKLPSRIELEFDFDDIVRRSLYHLDKSYKVEFIDKNIKKSERHFTKAVFKLAFYLCIYFDEHFHSTLLKLITKRINMFVESKIIERKFFEFLKKSIIYRRKLKFQCEFHELRHDFTEFIFSSIEKGRFHRQMDYNQLKYFLEKSFQGLNYLIQILKNSEKKH